MRGFARLLDEPRSAIKVQIANGQANLSLLGRRQEFVNAVQVKRLLVLMVFVVIGFGPLSPTCLLGLYVVIARPKRFKAWVEKIYLGNQRNPL